MPALASTALLVDVPVRVRLAPAVSTSVTVMANDVGVDTTVFARPSLLEGDRSTLQQPPRAGERWLHVVMRALRPVTPANLRAIEARDVALSLMDAARTQGPGAHVLLSGALQRR